MAAGFVARAQSDRQSVPVAGAKPTVAQKHLMPAAVQVKITPRGLKYFEKNLSQILGNIGISLEEGYFGEMSYEAEKALKLEELELPAETRELLVKVRSLLTSWLVGFPLKDIRPSIQIGETGYTAEFSRFALVADEDLLKRLGKREGAVLAAELEIKELNVNLSRIRAHDMNAKMLGEVGFDQARIKLGGGARPVKLRVPFYIRVNSRQQLEFEALKPSENFSEVDLEFKYRQLVVPTIVLEINNHRMELNKEQLERELQSNMPTLLKSARGFLSEFAGRELPALLNAKAKEALAGSLEEINKLDPPGAEPGKPVQPLLWGLQLEKISQSSGLSVQLQAFVEDPLNPRTALLNGQGSRGPVRMDALGSGEYDIAMSIDRALINRILQLSYNRKLFEKISVGEEGFLRLTSIPTVDFSDAPAGARLVRGEAFIRIKIRARVPQGSVKGFNSLFLRDNFEVAFDLIAKMRKIPYKGGAGGGVEIILADIDQSTLWLNPDDIRPAGKLLSGVVISGVKDRLREISSTWSAKEEKLPGTLPLPPEVLGIRLEIDHMVLDRNGHLVMYLRYAK